MKFRYVLVILAGIVITVVIISVSTIARARSSHYKFLGNNRPKEVRLQTDSVGWVGREERFFVLHKEPRAVANEADRELTTIGWRRVGSDPAVFQRGPHETIDVRGARQYTDPKLLEGIPKEQLANYTVVKIIDPRMPPALRHRIARWTHNPLRRILRSV